MTKIQIIIPVKHPKVAMKYYCEIMGFTKNEGLLFLPGHTEEVALRMMLAGEDTHHSHREEKLPIFSYMVEKNFLSYCFELHQRGAIFESAGSHPGGFYAYVNDPEGNQFEICCESFEEDENVDTEAMPFFFDH